MPRIGARHKVSHQSGGNDEISLSGLTIPSHKTQHQDGETDEINATGLTGRCDFVSRGNTTNYDFDVTDFTTDGNQHDLDLSGIVPEGAKAVLLRLSLADDAANSYIQFRPRGQPNIYNSSVCYTQVAGITDDKDLITPLPADRKLTYSSTNTTFLSIDIVVKGWWI